MPYIHIVQVKIRCLCSPWQSCPLFDPRWAVPVVPGHGIHMRLSPWGWKERRLHNEHGAKPVGENEPEGQGTGEQTKQKYISLTLLDWYKKEKKRDFNRILCVGAANLCQLSYEDTYTWSRPNCWFHLNPWMEWNSWRFNSIFRINLHLP